MDRDRKASPIPRRASVPGDKQPVRAPLILPYSLSFSFNLICLNSLQISIEKLLNQTNIGGQQVHDNDEDSGTEEPDVQDVNGQDQQVPRITPRQRPPIIDDEDNIPDQQMQPLDPPPLLDLGDPPQGEPEETGNVNEALHVEREVAELVRFHEGTGVLLIPKSQKKNSEGNSPNQELKKWLQDLSIRRDSDVKSEIVETLPPEGPLRETEQLEYEIIDSKDNDKRHLAYALNRTGNICVE
ncbi:hypothetical protein QYM36_002392 [Artemia franciscana]|uniref:Uncharacterized protein n=1 Tax=Artemia franciscana TaxID=6661 RepID=A0AA88ILN2_ARTSF|nr:hypothetical protein QYM36_002392 [Artemia franciscana]